MIFFAVLLAVPGYSQVDLKERKRDSLSRLRSFKDIDMGPSYIYNFEGLFISQGKYDSLGLCQNEITKREVLSRDEGLRIFGSKGRDGVILINTNKLIIVDGIVFSGKDKPNRLENIDEIQIKAIRNISTELLYSGFGLKGNHGAIVIETK